jgi:mannosyltransferase
MLFGDSEFALRFLSVVFGVLAIPMTFAVGRQLFDEEVGMLGALILALSAFNVQYSQQSRMYSLMVLLTLLSMYFFLRLLRKSSRAISAGYVLVTTLLLYTHIYGLIVLLAQNIYLAALLFLSREKTVRLRQWIVLQAIVVGLFALWIPVFMSHISLVTSGFWVPRPTLSAFVNTFITYAGTIIAFPGTLLFIVFLGLAVLSLFTYTKVTGSMDWKALLNSLGGYSWNVHITNVASVTLLVVWMLSLNVVPFVISFYSTPIYYTRYTIAASVALYLLVAGGVRNINWRYAKIAVIAVIVTLSAVNLQGYYNATTSDNTIEQAHKAFSYVIENAKSGDVVIVYPGLWKYVWDYYENGTNVDVMPFPATFYYHGLSWENQNTIKNIKELQSDVNGHSRVWFIRAGTSSFTPFVQALNTSNESYESKSSQAYGDYTVILLEKRN